MHSHAKPHLPGGVPSNGTQKECLIWLTFVDLLTTLVISRPHGLRMSFWARWASAPMLCIIHVVHPATIGNLRDHRRGLLQPRLSFEIRVVQTLAVGTSSEKIAKSAAHGVASASKVTALAHQRTHFGKEKFHNPSKFISVSSVNAVETAEARSSDIHRCRKLVAIVVDTGKGNDTPLGLSILYQHHRILVKAHVQAGCFAQNEGLSI